MESGLLVQGVNVVATKLLPLAVARLDTHRLGVYILALEGR